MPNRSGNNDKTDLHTEHIARYLACAFRSFEAYLDRKLQEKNFELTRGPLTVLFCLYRNSPLTQQQLSQRLYIDKSAVNRAVIKLEQQGFIVRSPSVEDRRKVNLTLTEKAAGYEPEITGLLNEVDREIRSGFTDEEYDFLKKSLQKFIGIMGFHSPGKDSGND